MQDSWQASTPLNVIFRQGWNQVKCTMAELPSKKEHNKFSQTNSEFPQYFENMCYFLLWRLWVNWSCTSTKNWLYNHNKTNHRKICVYFMSYNIWWKKWMLRAVSSGNCTVFDVFMRKMHGWTILAIASNASHPLSYFIDSSASAGCK